MFVIRQQEEMVNKTFRFPRSLLNKLNELAKENGVSVNQLMIQAAEYALNNMEGGADGEQVRGKTQGH